MTSLLLEQAYTIIKKDIITCSLKPGEQIAQSQLTQKYKIGTTPIREALQRLVQEGFVQSIPRFGYVVSYITLSDVHGIFEFRSILEPAAAYLAATRATDEQLDMIENTADFDYAYPDNHDAPMGHIHNAEFHRAIVTASGNRRLINQSFKTLDEMIRIFFLGIDMSGDANEMRSEHTDLVKALREQNANHAEQIMKEHLEHSKQIVLDALVRNIGTVQIDLANSQ